MSATPHDSFVRAIFSQPEHAASELQAVLPAAVLAEVDLGTLTALPGSFVGDELRQRHSDLLFSVRLRAGGDRRWSAARQFSDLFGLSPPTLEALRRHVVQFEILVDDLTGLDDRDLKVRATDAVATLALLALKHARRSRDLRRQLLDWTDLFFEVLGAPGGAVAFGLIQRYILEASPHVDVEFLAGELASKLEPDAREQIVTTGQQLIEQGRQLGRSEGRSEGFSKGRAGVLVAQLGHRFGSLPADLVARIETASAEQLDLWAIRVLDAKALAEVFAEGR